VSLNDSRADLIKLLKSLTSLGTVATRVEKETQAQTVKDLRTLQPTLDRLNQAGDSIENSLELLVTYPFGDNALKAIFSDYTGLYATVNIDLRNGSTANPLGPTGLCGTLSASVASQSLCSVLGMLQSALPGTGAVKVPTLPTAGVVPTATPSAAAPGNTLTNLLPKLGASAAATPAPSPTPSAGLVGGLLNGLTGGGK
jgi:phospholipid/cholesterol/gamma-HCH transport system substrate-binding protein